MGSVRGQEAGVKRAEDWNPKVSIIIPVYNGSDYLREAIDSALAQTYRNIEVIVVNDGSTDDGKTEAIALSYGERIRYLRKENGGVASALNLGIREMTGDYFSWLSHDDLYYPDKTAVQVDSLRQTGGDTILFGDYDLIDQDSRPAGVLRVRQTAPGTIYYALIMEGAVNGCTVLVPRRCFAAVGEFDEQLRTTQDFDMWFRLARKHEFRHIANPLIKSRIHPVQGSRTIASHLAEQNDLYIKALKDVGSNPLLMAPAAFAADFYARAAMRLVTIGCNDAAELAINLCRKNLPWSNPGRLGRSVGMLVGCSLVRAAYRVDFLKKTIKTINRMIHN
jgi:glycosyltransferase involved in cell wall biosynthesis